MSRTRATFSPLRPTGAPKASAACSSPQTAGTRLLRPSSRAPGASTASAWLTPRSRWSLQWPSTRCLPCAAVRWRRCGPLSCGLGNVWFLLCSVWSAVFFLFVLAGPLCLFARAASHCLPLAAAHFFPFYQISRSLSRSRTPATRSRPSSRSSRRRSATKFLGARLSRRKTRRAAARARRRTNPSAAAPRASLSFCSAAAAAPLLRR